MVPAAQVWHEMKSKNVHMTISLNPLNAKHNYNRLKLFFY